MAKRNMMEMIVKSKPVDSTTVWARCFREAIKELTTTSLSFEQALDKYSETHRGNRKPAAVCNMRRRIIAKLTSDHMTWEDYCFGLNLFQVENIEISISVTAASGKKLSSEHQFTLA